MGFFSKKNPCPICGGKPAMLLPTKIEGEALCGECAGKIDMDGNCRAQLTISSMQDYITYYENNRALAETFNIDEKISFGMLDTKFVFDFNQQLFSFSADLKKTIFKGSELISFCLYADNELLFEGSEKGLIRYESTIPERARAMEPQLMQMRMNQELMKTLDRMDGDDDRKRHHHHIDIMEPFKEFIIELNFDHPYWPRKTADMDGPIILSQHPDINDYLNSFYRDMELMEQLVTALMDVAFPGAGSMTAAEATAAATAAAAPAPAAAPAATSQVDVAEALKKFKDLVDCGVLTEEEFQAKKKQLLGL